MTELLLAWVPPVATLLSLTWAAWLALAAEATVESAVGETTTLAGEPDPPLARRLHVAHLTLLFLAGAAAAGTVAWWTRSGGAAVLRAALAVVLVWVVGDLLPRIIATLEPRATTAIRAAALRTLPVFRPLFALVARADRLGRGTDATAEPPDVRPGPDRPAHGGYFSLGESTVADVMTPRVDIVAIDAGATVGQAESTLSQSEYARLPVYDGTLDQIVGVLYAKDFLKALSHADEPDWRSLVRPAVYVPSGKRLDRQLREFQRARRHLAVVVDEHGGTAGLVTLEDILEEIVGEIQDEYDVEEVAEIQQIDASTWLVQGATPLADLEKAVGLAFAREDVSTVGGLVMAEFGRVPKMRESLLLSGCRLTVDQMVRRRVQRVVVHRLVATESDAAEGNGR